MDRLLAESRRSGATWEVKNWLLHDLGDIETYHACLTYEESICRTVFDFTSCARDWIEHFGDRTRPKGAWQEPKPLPTLHKET